MSFPISLASGFGELAARDCPGQGWEKSAHGACVCLGKWISIYFLGPENKRKINKKPGQMAALVKAEDTGDGDKHEGLHGRSWGCGEPLAPAGSICTRCSLRASPGGGRGDETGLAWLSTLAPKPLLQNAGSRRAGAGTSQRGAGLALQGLHVSAGQRRGPLQPAPRGNWPSLSGQSYQQGHPVPCHPSPCPPLPCRPASAAGTGSSSGTLSQQTLPTGGKQSKAGAVEGAMALEEARGGQPDP